MATSLYVGLMSGTSADGIDACLARIGEDESIELGHCHHPFAPELRRSILSAARGDARSAELATLDVDLADAAVAVIRDLLDETGTGTSEIRAIGSHGQTVLHRAEGPAPTSIQLGDPHRIAVASGIDTAADFRRADIAAGGQGAPLAPAFHQHIFANQDECRAVVNLGGIANVTLLAPPHPIAGFDTGPANMLLDAWIARHHDRSLDADGAWAAGGLVNQALLARLRADRWFQRPPPKSTGRERFDLPWLEHHLAAHGPHVDPRDVQATLAELTAVTIADAIQQATPTAIDRILVCGGGARNSDLLERLHRRIGGAPVETTDAFGMDPLHVEAMAFAWLAHRRITGQSANCPSVTGAARELVLGSLIRAPDVPNG